MYYSTGSTAILLLLVLHAGVWCTVLRWTTSSTPSTVLPERTEVGRTRGPRYRDFQLSAGGRACTPLHGTLLRRATWVCATTCNMVRGGLLFAVGAAQQHK